MKIAGQTALVTGAGSGIGRELCLVMAERGAGKILLIDIDEAGIAETARQISAHGVEPVMRRTNVADIKDLAAAFEDASRHAYRICFNNAGIVLGLPNYPDASDEKIELVVRTDLTAVLIGTKYAIQHLRALGGDGVIVNTGSEAAVIPMFDNIPYRVAKTGVHYLTDCCRPLIKENIRVNAFHPGGTLTPIVGKLGGDQPTPQWALDRMKGIKMWPVRYIADAAMGLVEDDSRAGENLVLLNERDEDAPRAAP